MAKYTVNYSCGHSGSENLVGRTAERDRRIAWLEASGHCPACYTAKMKAAQEVASVQAQRTAASAGLPPLSGTEKQCAWAETIRKGFCDHVTKIAEWMVEDAEKAPEVMRPFLDALAENPLEAANWAAFLDASKESETGFVELPDHVVAVVHLIDTRYREPNDLMRMVADEPKKLAAEEERRKKDSDAAQSLREAKEMIARTIAGFLNTPSACCLASQVKVWGNGEEKRIYIGHGFNSNCVSYFHTGNAKTKPGTVQLTTAATEAVGERVEEFKAYLATLATRWKSITVHIAADGSASNE